MSTLTLAAALLPFPLAAAQTCHARTYSPAHMQANPAQQVRQIRALHRPATADEREHYEIRTRFRDDAREYTSTPYCEDREGRKTCYIECDGGWIEPSRDSQGRLRLLTEYLRAEAPDPSVPTGEGGCTEPIVRSIADDAPPGEIRETTFVLEPQDVAICTRAQ